MKLKQILATVGLVALLRPIYRFTRAKYYLAFGRPKTQLEATKARARREREGFFDKYCQGKGLDIGYGGDLLTPDCQGWDYEHGDGTLLKGLKDESFDFVHTSHTLEHIPDAELALKNWWRVLKPGGFLIIYLPHRDLYERRTTLPSRWNSDHKHFFLPDADEPPDTLGLLPLVKRALPDCVVEYLKVCDEGHLVRNPDARSEGEYSIETVLR
ncbi:class I SAM-dependent methyltransferase, partial [Calditrichota bacterium]